MTMAKGKTSSGPADWVVRLVPWLYALMVTTIGIAGLGLLPLASSPHLYPLRPTKAPAVPS
ncbi:hypothetical protein ADK76_08555 [Streptomyces griseoflavus]|nr:hypothetical protein ADK76_08555 [Streptomyces griseoflavus]